MEEESSSSSNEQDQEQEQNVYTTVSESSSESEEEQSAEDGQHEQGDVGGDGEGDEQQQEQQQQQPVQQSIKEIVFADEDGNIIAAAPAVVSDDTLYLTVGTREAVSIPEGYFETQTLADGFSAASGLVIIFVVFAIFGAVVSRTLLRSFEND